MTHYTLAEIYDRVRNGDTIEDDDLKRAFKFYDKLAKNLNNAGMVFYLAHKEATQIAQTLEGFIEARVHYKENRKITSKSK